MSPGGEALGKNSGTARTGVRAAAMLALRYICVIHKLKVSTFGQEGTLTVSASSTRGRYSESESSAFRGVDLLRSVPGVASCFISFSAKTSTAEPIG